MNENEKLFRQLKRFMENFFVFRIRDYDYSVMEIEEGLTWKENLVANKMWIRGIPRELSVFYKTVMFGNKTFWGSKKPVNYRCRHWNLPNIIVKTLTDITVNDLNQIDIDNELYKEIWEKTEKDNKFIKSLNKVVKNVLVYGDGAFKINYKSYLQDTPFISFISAENVEYVYEDERIKEIIFKKTYKNNLGKYYLLEFYGWGYIRYKLFDENMNEVQLSTVEELKDLKDIVFYNDQGEIDSKIMLAVRFSIWESDIFENEHRGKSIFEDRREAFDFLDEVLSIFDNALLKGQLMSFIDVNLIPKDKNGNLIKDNDFFVDFIQLDHTGYSIEGSTNNQVQVVEPNLQVDKYNAALQCALEKCLMGILSPSTIGISSDKINENALAEREKERVTIFTRNNIIEALRYTIEEVIKTSIKLYCYQNNIDYNDDYDISVIFGEWASPSFDNIVETLAKAAPGKQVLTWEEIVNNSYPEKSDEEKEQMVEELKSINGVGVEADYVSMLNDTEEEI